MTKAQKKTWLRNFTKSILNDLTKAVDDGRIPEEWGGVELSEVCALKFDEQSHLRGGVITDPDTRNRRNIKKKEVSKQYIVANI